MVKIFATSAGPQIPLRAADDKGLCEDRAWPGCPDVCGAPASTSLSGLVVECGVSGAGGSGRSAGSASLS